MIALMQKAKYSGEPVKLGRFRLVRDGDVLELSEEEAQSLRKDKRFTFEVEERIMNAPAPCRTRFMDLRTVDWANERLAVVLDRKFKDQILEIAYAMKSIELPVRVATRMDKRGLVDAVIEAARRAGWTVKLVTDKTAVNPKGVKRQQRKG